ncbi:MAG: InlB B-repeat-containing protein, partial [Acutalibacteraceae bacterium]|nr:InlB B-repeat-containing protein [Acutalibacteraceae bacterium]
YIQYNTLIQELPTATRTGYTFDGWYTQANGGTKVNVGDRLLYSDWDLNNTSQTLYAHWTINQYKLTYDNEFDFDNFDFVNSTYPKTSGGSTLTVNEKENSISFTSSNGDDYTRTGQEGTPASTGYMNLIPGHTYEVSYDYTVSKADTINCFLFAYKTANDTSWVNGNQYISVSGSGSTSFQYTVPTGYYYGKLRFGTGSADVALTVSNICVRDLTDPMNYKASDGINPSLDKTSDTVTFKATQSPLATITRQGYTFNGWYESENTSNGNGYGTQFTTSTAMPARDVPLFAQWALNDYQIIINLNADSLDNATIGSFNYSKASNTASTGAIALTSEISAQQTVTGNITTISVAYGTSFTLPIPSRPGYTFAGWTASATPNYASLTNNGNSSASSYRVGAGGVTLTAQWTANTLIIEFNGNNSTSGNMEAQTFTYDQTQNLTANSFIKQYTITFNGNGGTIDGSSVVTDTAEWSFNGWNSSANGSGAYSYSDAQPVTNPCGLTKNNSSATLYAKWTGGNLQLKTAIRDGYTFVGWATTSTAEKPTYTVNQTLNFTSDPTLYAVWVETATANQRVEEIEVVTGITVTDNDLSYEPILKTEKKYVYVEDDTYSALCEAYEAAYSNFNASKTIANASALVDARNNLNAYSGDNVDEKFKYDAPIKDYINNFEIEFASGVSNLVTPGRHNLGEINLNHYTDEILGTSDISILKQLEMANAVTSSLQQNVINDAVKQIAKDYITFGEAGSKPTVDFYETPEKVAKMLKSEEAVEAVNYLRTDYGYTYYCYVNSKTPIVFLNAVEESEILKSEIETASTTSTRLGYPTRATVTSSGGASAVTTKHLDSSDYSNYINAGIGSNYSGYVNGELLTGEYYYNAYTQIMLSPVFTSDKQEIVYTIKATDDALVWKTQDDKGNKIDPVLTEGINYATTANMSGETATGVSKTATVSEPSKGVTICFSYHNPGNSFDVSGDAVNNDTWLKQYHLFRSSGGASNWELPRPHNFINMKTGNPYDTYFVNDGTLGSSDKGSFFFTFKLGDSIDFTTKTVLDDGNIGYLPTLNTKDPEKIAAAIKEGTISFSSLKACQYTGTRSYYKVLENGEYERGADNKYKVYYGGTGYGFFPWPKANIWSVNYYPASGSYTYVHLVDRWGNSVDRVIEVGLQDAVDVSMETNASGYTILEEGGSGIDTLSLNSSNYEILADEVSTIENGVFTTQGNTVRISTGEANKAYTLKMTDKATNSSTATVKSDENGIITLSVEDTAYESGVYTFMLNSIEVNLYDGAETDKYVLSVSGDEVSEGETAQITVTTKGDVSKLRFTDASGNTSTVSSFVQNDDGTRTWTFAKAKPAGEYTYRITVKVGHEWLDEGDTAALIFNERILDSGKVRSAEYDEETGLYKVTFEGRATKVQFVSEDGMTRTYTRYAEAVKSRKTYDADGNEVNDTARTLDHEVWYVEAKLYSGQNYKVVGKFEAGWNRAEDAASTVTGK